MPDFSILKLYKWHLKLISEAAIIADFDSCMRKTVSDAPTMLKFSIKFMSGY